MNVCDECDGRGYLEHADSCYDCRPDYGDYATGDPACVCSGDGYTYYEEDCPVCDGTGGVER